MIEKLKADVLKNKESYGVLLATAVYFLLFPFEIRAVNHPGVDMEVSGLTIIFKLFLTLAFAYLGYRLRYIDAENKNLAVPLIMLGVFAYIPSHIRIINAIPVSIIIGIGIWIVIQTRHIESRTK